MFYTSSGYLPIIERHDGLEARRSESSIIREYFIAGEGKGLIGLMQNGWRAIIVHYMNLS